MEHKHPVCSRCNLRVPQDAQGRCTSCGHKSTAPVPVYAHPKNSPRAYAAVRRA